MGCELMRQMMHGLTSTVFAFAVATGAATQDLTGEVAACAGISDATQRLACYDALAHPAEQTPKQMPAQLPAASELRLQEFGAEQIPRDSDPAAQPDDDSIMAGVSGISLNSCRPYCSHEPTMSTIGSAVPAARWRRTSPRSRTVPTVFTS